MPKLLTLFFIAVLFCFSVNGCTNKSTKNSKPNSEVIVSTELQKAIGNIDKMDSSKISNIPTESLDISF